MAKEQSQINLRIRDGEQFYANETSINFGPVEFVLDFKCATHVQDTGNLRGVVVKHNVVILTPYHVKTFSEVLSNAVKDYEVKFGKIKKPGELKKAEDFVKKEKKKIEKKQEDIKKDESTYFG